MTKLVTLVHTDIQGSTKLWEHAPGDMRIALEQHDRIQRQLIDQMDGYEIRTEGDAFLIAFDDCQNAFSFCLALQEHLLDAAWPEHLLDQADARVEHDERGQPLWAGPRVRAGILRGQAEQSTDPVTGRITYKGSTVHRCVALASVAHGGQIVTDSETWNGLARPIGSGVDLGYQKLPGQLGGLTIIQIASERLKERQFAALRGQPIQFTNLSEFTNQTVGHRRELDNLVDRLLGGSRCITIIGAPGVGKSRIAKAAALTSLPAFNNTTCFDIASCEDAVSIVQTLATGLSIPIKGQTPNEQVEHLGQALSSRGRLLLILDNADRCAEELAPILSKWIAMASGMSVMITSRKLISIDAQVTFRLQPLTEPEGVELFKVRAQERGTSIPQDEDNKAACLTIVRALDGIPLAIELAASRVGILNPIRIAERLHQRFRLLQTRHRDDDRQSTLSAALEWSWETLTDDQAQCLEALSVFQDGFELQAAITVTGSSSHDLRQQLRQLHEQSMLQINEEHGSDRYYLLQSIRLFAAERLERTGRADDYIQAHYKYYGDLGEYLFLQSQQIALADVLVPIQRERANLLAAIESASKVDIDSAVGAVMGLVPLLFTQGPVALGTQLILQLAADIERMSKERQTIYLTTLARVRSTLGEKELCFKNITQARQIADQVANPVHRALVLDAEIRMFSSLGQTEKAADSVREALAHLKTHPMSAYEAKVHSAIGNLYYNIGRVDDALEAFESSGNGFAALNMPFYAARSLGNAGVIHLAHQRFEKAEAHFIVCLRQHAEARNSEELARTHLHLGLLALDRGDLERATEHYLESVSTGKMIAAHEPVLVGLGYLGVIAQLRGRVEKALVRFDEALDSTRGHTPARTEAYFRAYHGGLLARLGRSDEAYTSWRRAERLLEGSSDSIAGVLIKLTQAQGWRLDEDRHADIKTLINRMHEPEGSEPSLHQRNEDIRIAVRLLEAG